MISSLKSFAYNFKSHPLRGVLILITVTIGVATLCITMSLSLDINAAIDSAFAGQGRRISILNGEINEQGDIESPDPPQFAPDVIEILASEYENLSDISFIAEAWIRPIIWLGDKTYEIRSSLQTDENYAKLMNLEVAAGRFFDKEDVDSNRKVIVIGALAARMLFGSPEAAVNKSITVAGKEGLLPHTIVGVYNEPPDLERESYGIADFIIPIITEIEGSKFHPIQYGAILMARITNDSLQKAESRIRSILEPHYGDDLVLTVREGLPNSTAPLIEESRSSVRNFARAVSILGFVILITSSIGIFSVMLVEVLNRTRDIGLRRALGTTRGGIRRYFIGQALAFSGIGSAAGIAVAIGLYRSVGDFLTPLFDSAGFRATDIAINVPGLFPVVVAVASALVFGALFGFFPAISAARTPIIECIREETA